MCLILFRCKYSAHCHHKGAHKEIVIIPKSLVYFLKQIKCVHFNFKCKSCSENPFFLLVFHCED